MQKLKEKVRNVTTLKPDLQQPYSAGFMQCTHCLYYPVIHSARNATYLHAQTTNVNSLLWILNGKDWPLENVQLHFHIKADIKNQQVAVSTVKVSALGRYQ